MNTSKISELSSVDILTNNDILPIVNEGDTKQVSIEKLQDILASKTYVDNAISALGALGFTPVIVESLPTENIDTHTIYLVPATDVQENNTYEEWLYIDNNWEKIGTTGGGSVVLDDTVTETSENGVKSSGIYNALGERMRLMDRSIYVLDLRKVTLNFDSNIESGISVITTIYTMYTSTEDREHIKTIRKLLYDSVLNANGWDNGSYVFIFANTTLICNGVMTHTSGNDIYSANQFNFTGFTLNGKQYTVKLIGGRGSISEQGNYLRTITLDLTTDSPISFDNTIEYTPTGDHNPATKKYVDDQVGSINTVLATLTTISEVTE